LLGHFDSFGAVGLETYQPALARKRWTSAERPYTIKSDNADKVVVCISRMADRVLGVRGRSGRAHRDGYARENGT